MSPTSASRSILPRYPCAHRRPADEAWLASARCDVSAGSAARAARPADGAHRVREGRFEDLKHLFEDILLPEHFLAVAVGGARHGHRIVDVAIGAQHEEDEVRQDLDRELELGGTDRRCVWVRTPADTCNTHARSQSW